MRLNPFKSPQPKPEAQTPSQVIKAKLAECQAEIEASEATLRRVSLDAVLGENPAAGFDAVARLNELRAKRELLANALQVAEQDGQDARAALRHQDWQTRARALRQHLGRVQRDAADVTQALGTLRDAFRRLADTGQSIAALLPPSMRSPARPFHEMLSPTYLRDLADVEAFRLSQGGVPAPGAAEHPVRLRSYEDAATGAIKPLAEIISEIAGRTRSEFNQAQPNNPQSSPPLVTASSAPSVGVSPFAPSDAQRDGEVVDLRKHPAETTEPASEEVIANA